MSAKSNEITMSGKSSAKAKQGNKEKSQEEIHEDTLGALFGAFQAAVWLIGIAVLAWQDWWWPGIMVLVAISGITGPLFGAYISRRQAQAHNSAVRVQVETERAEALPHQCAACGAPLSTTSVIWRSPTTASCPYCNTSIKATRPRTA